MSIVHEIVAQKAQIEALRNALGRSIKVGPVEVVDAAKGYRLLLGEADGQKFLSPWYPHPETGKTSIPLKKGQIVGVINPGADPRQGILVRGGYSDEHASPNEDMAANVFSDAGVKISVADGALVIEAGGVTVNISGAGLKVTGGVVEHNSKNIGATHKHGGVSTGGALTDVPAG